MLRPQSFSSAISISALTVSIAGFSTAFAQTDSEDTDTIIVTGTGILVAPTDALQAVDILSEEELAASFDGSLGATLADLPGISTTNFGPAVGRPVIRGFGGDRVRILTNGIGLIDASTVSTDHALTSEGLEAERVEILRGSAAIPYGGNAIGGVVNIVDGSIPKEARQGEVSGRIFSGVTSVDNGTQLAGRAKTALGPFAIQIEGLRREADDVEIPGFAKSAPLRAQEQMDDPNNFDTGPFGVVTNTAFDFTTYGLGASLTGAWGFAGFSVRDYEANYGLPLEDANQVGIAMEQSRVDFNSAFNIAVGPFHQLNVTAGVIDYQHGENANGELQTLFENEGYEIRAAAMNGQANDTWRGSIGLQISDEDFSATGAEDFIPPGKTADIGAFISQRYDLETHGFEGGLRIDNREITPINGASLSYDTLSANIGAFLRPADGKFLGASLSSTQRAPTNAELFSNGFHPATGTFEIGNVDLSKETALSFETVFRAEQNDWLINAAAFYTSFSDFIFLANTGVEDPASEAPIFRYFQDDATYSGAELYVERTRLANFGPWTMKADATIEYIRAETENLGNVPFIPPLSAIFGLELQRDFMDLRLQIEAVDEARNQAQFETPSEGYSLTDFSAVIRPPQFENVKIIAKLENAFDEEARLNTSQLKDIVPQPGRSLRLSLSVDF